MRCLSNGKPTARSIANAPVISVPPGDYLTDYRPGPITARLLWERNRSGIRNTGPNRAQCDPRYERNFRGRETRA